MGLLGHMVYWGLKVALLIKNKVSRFDKKLQFISNFPLPSVPDIINIIFSHSKVTEQYCSVTNLYWN